MYIYLPNLNCVLCRCTSELRLLGMEEYKNLQNCTVNMYLFLHNAQNTYLLQPRQKYFIGKLHKWWQLIFASLPCSSNPRKTFHIQIQNLYWALPIMAGGPWTIMVPIWTIWYYGTNNTGTYLPTYFEFQDKRRIGQDQPRPTGGVNLPGGSSIEFLKSIQSYNIIAGLRILVTGLPLLSRYSKTCQARH